MRQAPGRPDTLKAATARLVQANGGLAKSAQHIGISRSRLQELIDPRRKRFLDVNQILILELACGEAIVTGFLAHEQGASLNQVPRESSDQRLNINLARIGEATAHLFSSCLRGIRENRLDPRSVPAVTRATDDLISRATEFRASVRLRSPR